jgi:hypothetical protein
MANLITLDEYRDYDDLPSPADNEDQINAAIAQASAYIENVTGRTFAVADPSPSPTDTDVVEVVNGTGCARLYTRNAPITSVTKLEYWDGDSWEEYDLVSYPYTLKTGSHVVYFTQGHRFCKGYQNIRVTYSYGYTTALPADLKYACYLVAHSFVLESERTGIASQSDGEQSFSYDHSVPKQAIATLARYKTVY